MKLRLNGDLIRYSGDQFCLALNIPSDVIVN